MNKKTLAGILLSVLCLLLLLGLGLYLFMNLNNNEAVDSLLNAESPFRVAESETAASAPSFVSEQPETSADLQRAAALDAIEAAVSPLPKHQLIFVGDSRTVGMGDAQSEANDPCLYIGEVGEGYHWFADTGIELMEAAMKDHPDAPVILNLGVNDPDSIENYLSLYRTFPERYPEHSIYFLSVNPVTEDSAHITNMEISDFNARIKEAFPDQYLDSYTFLLVQEFESADGVHYSEDTYRMLHEHIVRTLFSETEESR